MSTIDDIRLDSEAADLSNIDTEPRWNEVSDASPQKPRVRLLGTPTKAPTYFTHFRLRFHCRLTDHPLRPVEVVVRQNGD